MGIVILCLAMIAKLIILIGLVLKNFSEQLYKTTFSILKEKFIKKLMELLWYLHLVLLWQMHFYVSINRFDLMNILMNLNLHTSEDMLMTYLICFVHLIILRNSKAI